MFLHFHKKRRQETYHYQFFDISPSVLFLLGRGRGEVERIKKKGQKKERKMILLQKGKKCGLKVTLGAGLSVFRTIEEMVSLGAR